MDRLTGQTAIVSWVPLTPDETRGLLTTLQIAYVPLRDGGQCQPIIEDGSNVLHMTEDLMVQSMASITGLLPNLPYCVAMQVGTSAGESGFSETLTLPRECSYMTNAFIIDHQILRNFKNFATYYFCSSTKSAVSDSSTTFS